MSDIENKECLEFTHIQNLDVVHGVQTIDLFKLLLYTRFKTISNTEIIGTFNLLIDLIVKKETL